MKTQYFAKPLLALGVLMGLCTLASSPASAEPTLDPEGDRILRAACQYLADARSFCVKVEVWHDAVLENGSRIQTTRLLDLQQRRQPDRLHIELRSAGQSRGFWYEGKSLTILDRNRDFYGVIETPEKLDEAIDALEDRFGIEIPLGDVLVANPYANLMEKLESLTYLGKVTVLDTPCHHLAFVGRNADYQVWIADGPRPLPRKISISFKNIEGSPQVTQIFSQWDTVTPIAESVFHFAPSEGAVRISVLPRRSEQDASATPSTQPASK